MNQDSFGIPSRYPAPFNRINSNLIAMRTKWLIIDSIDGVKPPSLTRPSITENLPGPINFF